jgi:hypothetical protein
VYSRPSSTKRATQNNDPPPSSCTPDPEKAKVFVNVAFFLVVPCTLAISIMPSRTKETRNTQRATHNTQHRPLGPIMVHISQPPPCPSMPSPTKNQPPPFNPGPTIVHPPIPVYTCCTTKDMPCLSGVRLPTSMHNEATSGFWKPSACLVRDFLRRFCFGEFFVMRVFDERKGGRQRVGESEVGWIWECMGIR